MLIGSGAFCLSHVFCLVRNTTDAAESIAAPPSIPDEGGADCDRGVGEEVIRGSEVKTFVSVLFSRDMGLVVVFHSQCLTPTRFRCALRNEVKT